jgi:Spy/CpxP family protein refolding chaperone
MKNSSKFAACLALVFAAGTALVRAETADDNNAPPPPPPPGHERGPGGRGGPSLEKLSESLGLTADQQAKIGPLIKQRMEAGRAIREDTSLTREQMMEKMKANREEGAKEIEALLTPDQIAKFKALREEMRNRGPRGDHQGPPPPPPPGT